MLTQCVKVFSSITDYHISVDGWIVETTVMGNTQKLVRCMRFKIHDVITPARAALLRHQQKACRAKPRQHFHAMH